MKKISIIIILILSIQVLAIDIIRITNDEENSGYFRKDILKKITDEQVLLYLKRKEINEKKTKKMDQKTLDIILGAKYLQGQYEPFDRKLDPNIGKEWAYLSRKKKEEYKLKWFRINRDSISLQDMQEYININGLVAHARESETQKKVRENLNDLNLDKILKEAESIKGKVYKRKHVRRKKKVITHRKKKVRRRIKKKNVSEVKIVTPIQTELKDKITIIIPKLEVREPVRQKEEVISKTDKDKKVDYIRNKINKIKKKMDTNNISAKKKQDSVGSPNYNKIIKELRQSKIGE